MSAFDDYIRSCARNGNVEAKVLGVGGSPRKGGNSDVLMQHIVRGVSKTGMFAGSLQLRDYHYGGCIGCERCRKDKICTGLKDGMTLIYPELIESRGLILVSPTHNYNVTAWMKAFIDRFGELNFVNDTEMAAQLRRVREEFLDSIEGGYLAFKRRQALYNL